MRSFSSHKDLYNEWVLWTLKSPSVILPPCDLMDALHTCLIAAQPRRLRRGTEYVRCSKHPWTTSACTLFWHRRRRMKSHQKSQPKMPFNELFGILIIKQFNHHGWMDGGWRQGEGEKKSHEDRSNISQAIVWTTENRCLLRLINDSRNWIIDGGVPLEFNEKMMSTSDYEWIATHPQITWRRRLETLFVLFLSSHICTQPQKKQRDVSNRNHNTDVSYEESSLLLPSLISTVNYFVCRSHFQDYYQSLNTIPFRFKWSALCSEIYFEQKAIVQRLSILKPVERSSLGRCQSIKWN